MNVWVWARSSSLDRARSDGYTLAPSMEAFFCSGSSATSG
jgi:hypothetical protein